MATTGADDAGLQQLVHAFTNTLNPDNATRNAAEEFLSQSARHHPSFLIQLLRVGTEATLLADVRLAALVMFKNGLQRSWVPLKMELFPDGLPPNRYVISDADRATLRSSILDALVRSGDVRLAKVLAWCVGEMAHYDMPLNLWPALIPTLVEFLNQESHLDAATRAVAKVADRFEMCRQEKRGPLDALLQTTFPRLLAIMQMIVARGPAQAQTTATMVVAKRITKTFQRVVRWNLPPLFAIVANIQPWIATLDRLVLMEPAAQMDPEFAKHFWKIKTWALMAGGRIIGKYGYEHTADDEYTEFAKEYVHRDVPAGMLEAVMVLFSWRARFGAYVQDSETSCPPTRVLQEAMSYVSDCANIAKYFKSTIKPHLEPIITSIIFPFVLFTPENQELWNDEPQEYLRTMLPTVDEEKDPRVTACYLLSDLCKNRAKTVMPVLMQFLESVLAEYAAAPANAKPYVRKDGVITIVGSLSSVFEKKKAYRGLLEGFCMQHILPDLQSPMGFVRARACWAFKSLVRNNWKSAENKAVVFRAVLELLNDPEVIVRAHAASVIYDVYATEQEELIEVTRPVIKVVITQILKIMSEVAVDEVVSALSQIVEALGADLVNDALDLVKSLIDTFLQYQSETDDEDFEMTMASANCLDAIRNIVMVVCEHAQEKPTLVRQVSIVVYALLGYMLGPTTLDMDNLETSCELLQTLVMAQQQIEPDTFQFVPMLATCFTTECYDYGSELCVPLENIIEKDPKQFVMGNPAQGLNYVDMVMGMVNHTLQMEEPDPRILHDVVYLYSSMLLTCTGAIDAYVPRIVQNTMVALDRIPKMVEDLTKTYKIKMEEMLRVRLVTVLESALYYNAPLALQAIGQEHLGAVMQMVIKTAPEHGSEHEKKLAVLAMANILAIPLSAMPPTLQQGVSSILDEVTKVLVELNNMRTELASQAKAAEEGGDEEEEEDEDEDDDDDSDFGDADAKGFEDVDDDQDALHEDEAEYKKHLDSLRGFTGFDDDEDDEDDEMDYSSPIEHVDETLVLANVINGFMSQPHALELVQGRPAEVRQVLEAVVNKARAQQQ